jgi:hypothetical protein
MEPSLLLPSDELLQMVWMRDATVLFVQVRDGALDVEKVIQACATAEVHDARDVDAVAVTFFVQRRRVSARQQGCMTCTLQQAAFHGH